MKNSKNIHIISSTLKTVASENLVTENEILNAKDKPLQEVLNETQQKTNQKTEQSPNISSNSN